MHNMDRIKQLEGALRWFAHGEFGVSSMAIILRSCGIEGRRSHPYDPDDLRRCLLALDQVPGASVDAMRGASATWDAFIAAWPRLLACFYAEVPDPREPPRGQGAPETYRLMCEIRDATGRAA